MKEESGSLYQIVAKYGKNIFYLVVVSSLTLLLVIVLTVRVATNGIVLITGCTIVRLRSLLIVIA